MSPRQRSLALLLLLTCCVSENWGASTTVDTVPNKRDSERLIGWLGEVERPGSLRGASADAFGDDSSAGARKQWIEQISTSPRAYVWHGFMSHEECDHVVNTAKPLMEKSGVIDAVTGKETYDPIRTSYGAFLPIAYDDVVARVENRAAEWAMIPSSNQEQLHVLRYDVGQQYADHWDAFDANVRDKINYENGRQRLATILMYLNDVEEGGETVFPHNTAAWAPTADASGGGGRAWSECAARGPAVKPVKGDALLFYDLVRYRTDLRNTFDKAALHAGCPVLAGVKWTATKWIHETEYANPAFKAAACVDDPKTGASQCAAWARAGECDKNPNFMIGSGITPGSCIASCCGGGVVGGGRARVDFSAAKDSVKRFCAVCGGGGGGMKI